MRISPTLLVLLLVAAVPAQTAAQTADPTAAQPAEETSRHEGYYYPPVTSVEVYPARATMMPDTTRQRRIGFVVAMTQEQLKRPYAPTYAVYAKGAEQEKMIITALNDSDLATLYQARGLLAQLTAVARAAPIFVQNRVEDYFTFLDLLKMLGFTELTVSDGRSYAHRITIE